MRLERLGTRIAVLAALGAALGAGLAGCGTAQRGADTREIYSRAATSLGDDRVPVVVIPGILGSRLEEAETGQSVWGAFVYGAADADRPDGARLIALPMESGVPLDRLRDEVVATEALDTVEIDTLGFLRGIKVEAYAGVLKTLAAGKYRDELLARDAPVDYGGGHFTCFQFAYDWRRDIAESAADLGAAIEAAQQAARGARSMPADEPIQIDVVAHSMGGLVLRYYLRYGTQPLPADGSLPVLNWAGAEHVRWAVIVATPSAGSVLAVEQLEEGLNLNPIGPNYRKSVLGTMPAVYQLMPRTRHGRVVDGATGEPIDLYDPQAWIDRGWGLADPAIDRELAVLLPDVGPSERRDVAIEHLRKCLTRAEQLHRALDVPASPPPGLEFVLFAGDAEGTPDVLAADEQGALREVRSAPGDGTVTRSSALMDEREGGEWRPRLRSPIAWDQVRFLPEDHLGVTTSPVFTNDLLYLLLESPGPRSGVSR